MFCDLTLDDCLLVVVPVSMDLLLGLQVSFRVLLSPRLALSLDGLLLLLCELVRHIHLLHVPVEDVVLLVLGPCAELLVAGLIDEEGVPVKALGLLAHYLDGL